MSTRRARIKAVTSLPPRRKNTESADTKNKQVKPIDNLEKISKSPQIPKSSIASNQIEISSSNTKHSSESQVNKEKTIPSPVIKTPNILEKSPASAVPTLVESPQRELTLKNILEKSQLSGNPLKNTTSLFASPFRKESPKRTFASPALPSPKLTKNLDIQKSIQKPLTPIAQKINENNELQISENMVSKISHKSSNTKNDESIIENHEAMDGIVPLQRATVPKPIEVLKSEIISENAEVLFDPIVPLPSPSKVRPKLKPVPRLGPHRRNSVQGSASESEDESRRNLQSVPQRQRHDSQTSHSTQSLMNRNVNRVRNDSVCSNASKVTSTPAPAGSPVKEKPQRVLRRQDTNRRMTAMKFKRETVKRDDLTMYDLIFYNPTSNPIVPDEDEIKIKQANDNEMKVKVMKKEEPSAETPQSTAAPVPQIKLGPQGEIILDEASLVIKQTDNGRKVSSVVYEGGWASSSNKYKRGPRTADWTSAETVRFYRALAAIGTDFTLMAPLFPGRTRKELKFKFKKEEKSNGAQVDKALRAKIEWNVTNLKEEFTEERAFAAAEALKEKEKIKKLKQAEKERIKMLKELRLRRSKASKAVELSMEPGVSSKRKTSIPRTADDIIEKAIRQRASKRKLQPVAIPATPTTQRKDSISKTPGTPSFATLTPLNRCQARVTPNQNQKTPDLATITPQIPANIETGSLVVLTVNDPSSPNKKMLQTYVAQEPGKLTPVALPATFLSSVVGYIKKNPKGTTTLSPQIMSQSVSDMRSGESSPVKRQRHSSYTITQL